MKIGILEPSDFSDLAINQLNSFGYIALFNGKNIGGFVKDKEVLFVRLAFAIDAKLLSKAPNLKFICSPTTGLNHIDLDYCNSKNISIVSLKGETKFLKTIRATPEHTLGLLLALYRNYHAAFLSSNNLTWDREPHKGYEIFNSKVGIIGFGRVGAIVAKYLNALGAHVGFYDIDSKKKSKEFKSFNSQNELIKWSDAVLLTASFDALNGAILDKKAIKLLEGKYFVNTARAELTDEDYLVKAANNGLFKGLAVDVITEEQGSKKHLSKLIEAGKTYNVIVTPHIAGATFSSMARTELFIVKKLFNLIEK
ncbi:MAG: hypothetical protein IT245_08365 [Bacteroidia bacterium]|nr:hypothetical protein [Bacteroidia bacterium]